MPPWDHIVALGWGPIYAAARVLELLRKADTPEQLNLKLARWYYQRLKEMKALNKLVALRRILTKEELEKLDAAE
jgi:hypothetical protein